MTDPFAAPAAPSAGVNLEDIKGALLLISVYSLETGIQTTFGLKDAIRADVAVLDGDHSGEEHSDTLLFGLVLQGQLKGRIGQKVLGRLYTGTAKPGQKPPWMLSEATEADKAVGVAYLADGFSAPATAGAAPF